MARKPARQAQTRAERNIAWIEQHCVVPEGKLVGKPVVLREWQRAEMRKIYDNPAGTRRAILSFGRKNGKTAFAAMLLLLHLCGPEARPNSQLFSAAQSQEQAGVTFNLAAKMVRQSATLSAYITIRDTTKQLFCGELGTLYRALSAEAATAFGLSPVFAIHDELGQVRGPRSSLYEAIETGSGAHDDPLTIIISTQAATDADLLSLLIDDAASGKNPKITLSLYTAPEDMDPWTDEALLAANPAFGDFQSAGETRETQAQARRMPSLEAGFRNLVLNQRVEATSPFVSRATWQSNGGPPLDDFAGLPVYAGLDLSETSDLTAFVMIAQVNGIWHVKPVFWLPAVGLADKAATDRVPYDLWHQQGYLETTPGSSIEYEHVARLMVGYFRKYNMRAVGFDRHNLRFLLPWLRAAGMTEDEIARFIEIGQGFVGMGPAVRELESQLLQGHFAHGNHPVLSMCAANAVSDTDEAGNRKLNKRKSTGRIDGMVSLAMAIQVAVTAAPAPERSFWEA